MATLQNQLNTYQANLAPLLNFFRGSATNYVDVIEPAIVPTSPIGPRTMQNVLLAATVGLILAVGAAFLLEYLDDTIKTPDDIQQALGLFTMGAITRISGDRIEDKLVTTAHPRSPIAEAYRALRTNLQFFAVDKPLKTLLVTSANPIEGKSLTAANLGVVMAQAGMSVILVDSDLRRPVLHRVFQLTKEEGLTNALLQGISVSDGYLQATEVENLRVMTSGPVPPNPSELLASERMSGLIEHLKKQADVLLFDSPPCLAVTDAAVLSSQVDGVLLVVDAGVCRRELAVRAVDGLSKIGGNILGAVLNKLSPRGAGSYYYYYYYSEEGDETKRRKSKGFRSRLASSPLLRSVISLFRRGKKPSAAGIASSSRAAPRAPRPEAGKSRQEVALAGQPAGVESTYAQGMAHYFSREWKQARECLLQAKEMNPTLPGIDDLLADIDLFLKDD